MCLHHIGADIKSRICDNNRIFCYSIRSDELLRYYFDIDAPGDNNGAFHSCDLRYLFGRLRQSWRPYADRDYEVSAQLMDYAASYCRTGNPCTAGKPEWKACENGKTKVLCFRKEGTGMGKPSLLKAGVNMVTKGNPKA